MRESILIIEGDPSVQLSLQRTVEHLGYPVDAFQSEDKALHYLESGGNPAVILLELASAVRTGRSIVQRMRLFMPDTDILYVDSCGASQQLRSKGAPLPAHVLELPCRSEDLAAHLRHLLNNQQQRRLLRAATADINAAPVNSVSRSIASWPRDAKTSFDSAATNMPTPSTDNPAPDAAHALRVLLVEDNADTQWATAELLAALGHTVTCAASAEEALVKLSDAEFDVLCSDISLPGISGAELALVVAERYPATAIVFASGYGHSVEIDKQRLRAVVLPKPYTMAALQTALVQAVERRRAE